MRYSGVVWIVVVDKNDGDGLLVDSAFEDPGDAERHAVELSRKHNVEGGIRDAAYVCEYNIRAKGAAL
jgi:hypothetical protein